jgi:hypothetical protein
MINLSDLRAPRTLIAVFLSLTLLQACDSSGVVINDTSDFSQPGVNNSSGNNNGGNSGSGLGGPELVEPETEGAPTGEVAPVVSVSNLAAEDVAAARFLAQTTFGATQDDIAQLRNSPSLEAWIDAQKNLPVSLTEPYTRANSNGSGTGSRHEIWWNNVLNQPDQLRQRVAFALSQLFVVSDLDYLLANAQYGMSNYYDMLATNAFGNYRDLLEKVTLHPVMGVYLSMVRNEKADVANNVRPDENYAREVLQLFSIGLFELNNRGEALPLDNPRPAYTQDQVEEFARVFTGWNFSNVTTWETPNLGPPGVLLIPWCPTSDFMTMVRRICSMVRSLLLACPQETT